MRSPSPRVNEAAALEALARLKVLDSEPEAEFDALVHAASVVCGTPISLISLIDSERQLVQGRISAWVMRQRTPRDVSFCGHAVLGEQVFEIPDATSDVRFHDNPLVTGAPNVRFYAGAPIQLHQGEIVGTLCVVDHVPRSLDDSQRAVLASLATAVAKALEGRRATREISAAFEEVIDSRRQLVELNQSLERRIEERTFELREAVKSADVGESGKERLPIEHESRNTHADERGHRTGARRTLELYRCEATRLLEKEAKAQDNTCWASSTVCSASRRSRQVPSPSTRFHSISQKRLMPWMNRWRPLRWPRGSR